MNLKQIFLPIESRTLWGKRWAVVFFRSLHLCGIGVYTGGVFFGVANAAVFTSYMVTSVSGLALMAMDLYTNGKWIFQNRGFFIVIKLVVLGLLPHFDNYQKWGLLVIIIFSSFISHATADVRYYSIFHRKRI